MDNELLEFESLEKEIEKLKEWGLLSPKAKDLKKFMYKDNKNLPVECDIIGYLSKKTNEGRLSPIYETIVLEVNGININIAIGYLKEMQAGNFRGNEIG